jgi:predicted small lipoprotein YifL
MKKKAVLVLVCGLVGCGIKGPPLPPIQDNPVVEKKIEATPTPMPTALPGNKKLKNK